MQAVRLRLDRPFTSLVTRLAVVYLALALLAAGIVRVGVLGGELSALDRDLRSGWLAEETDQAAARLTNAGTDTALAPAPVLRVRMQQALTRLKRSGDEDDARAGVLSELSDPIGLQVWDLRGGVVAVGAPIRQAAAPLKIVSAARHPAATRVPAAKPGAWRYVAPLTGRDGRALGALVVELTPGPPGLKALIGDGVEWPQVLVYVLVFALGSALVLTLLVTRRLKRIAEAAAGWSAGDFTRTVDDASSDEIGALASRLNAMAAELETLVALRAELASLNERQRMARDLHDTVKQKAFALQLQLATARRGAAADTSLAATLDEARAITGQMQHELSALIEVAPAQAEAPFAQVLAERAQTWARWGAFAVSVDVAQAAGVPAGQRPIVLRVLDEALANVMRHSGAAHARLSLVRDEAGFAMTVEDDGCGLQGFAPGMGMANMQRRAAELPGGRLNLAETGPGVRLLLTWNSEEARP